MTKLVQFNAIAGSTSRQSNLLIAASPIELAWWRVTMPAKRTLAEELAELATPQPAPGELPARDSA